MTNGGDLPWELTEIIIGYLSLDSLRNAALVSRTFRTEARKYMYTSFLITANFSRDLVRHFLIYKERPDLLEAQERFAFFVSQPIATYIRSCNIEFVTQDPDSYALINTLCARLCDFPKLSALSFTNAHINEQRAQHISRCQQLTFLAFNSCTINPLPCHLRHQISTRFLSINDGSSRRFPTPQHWLSLVNQTDLSHLSLLTESSSFGVLEEMTSLKDVSIDTLSLHGSPAVIKSELLTTALSRCSQLVTLEVLTPSRGVSLLPFPGCITLDKFSGPHDMLKSVLETQKQLRRVHLTGMRWGNTCDLFDIQLQLPMLQACAPKLQAMQLRAFPTKALCTSITNLFPKLCSLAFELPLQTQKVEPMFALTRESFFLALLDMILPLDLQHLVILSMSPSNPAEGREVIMTLSEKYPSLTHIYLHFPDEYWMTWVEFPPFAEARNGRQGFQRGFLTSGYLNVIYDWF